MISVVVPVYNVEKYIVKCLESIVNQSYKDFELLLVNDGSTDNTVSLTSNYLKNTNIKWKLINKENGGQSSAKNLGLLESSGDYIVFMDSDDVVSNNFLQSLYEKIIESNADFSFCNFKYVNTQTPPVDNNNEYVVYSRNDILKSFLIRNISFVVPSILINKNYLIKNNIKFNENIRFSEDQMFIWDLLFHSSKCVYLHNTMYGYYLHEKSIMTASPFERIKNGHSVYKTYCDKLKNDYPNDVNLIKYILPRWELGTLYTSAKLVDYNEYKQLYSIMDGKTIFSRIKGIGERNAYLLGFVCSFSCRILYELCRKMNLNG